MEAPTIEGMASRRLWRWLRRLVLYPLLALTGATVLVGPGLEPVAGATVLVEDGVITQVGTGVAVPPGAETIDLAGHTVLPGLIDSHIHFGALERERGQDPGVFAFPRVVVDWVRFFPAKRRNFLAHGVTSVRSMGDEYPWINDVRRSVAEGEIEGPRFFVAGPLFGTRGGHPVVTIGVDPESGTVRIPESPTQAREMVRELVTGDDPVDLIKVVQERGDPARLVMEPIDPQILQAIVAEANAHDVRVFAHWGTFEDLCDVLAAGVDGLDHLEPRGVGNGWPDGVMRDRLREFHDAGGRVVAGSDASVPGVFSGAGLIRELELLVDAGLSPQAALVAATSTAADAMRVDHVGAISPGRAADLLVVKGDPLADIAAVRSVQLVLRDGRIVVENR